MSEQTTCAVCKTYSIDLESCEICGDQCCEFCTYFHNCESVKESESSE